MSKLGRGYVGQRKEVRGKNQEETEGGGGKETTQTDKGQ
jgi:hypothetical protein